MKRAVLLWTMLVALLMATGVALASTPSGTLDAHYTPLLESTSTSSGVNSQTDQGQTFTALNSGKVTSAQVLASANTSTTNPDAVVRMYIASFDNESGQPGMALASTTIPYSDMPATSDWVTGTFSSPPSVEAGKTYALLLTSEYTDRVVSWRGSSPFTGDAYPDGAGIYINHYYDVVWQYLDNFNPGYPAVDHAFAIYVASPFNFGDGTGGFSNQESPPTVNTVGGGKAGAALQIRFSLGGDLGLENIFEDGYPTSKSILCPTDEEGTSPADDTLVAESSSGLKYDETTDEYVYVWKTNKAWNGTCRELTMKLTDGSEHKLNFQFLK